MPEANKTRVVSNFRNTCDNCFNDIEFPLLGNFSGGELIIQTTDGLDFCLAVLVDNPTLDFIENTLVNDAELKQRKADQKAILTLVADKLNGKEFTTEYPICQICKARQRHFGDNIRTDKRELRFATWNDFESLTEENKIARIKNVGKKVK